MGQESSSVRFRDASKMVPDLPPYSFRVSHRLHVDELMSIVIVSPTGCFLLSRSRKFSHHTCPPISMGLLRKTEHKEYGETSGIPQVAEDPPGLLGALSSRRGPSGAKKKVWNKKGNQRDGGPGSTLFPPFQISCCIKLYVRNLFRVLSKKRKGNAHF